MPVDPKILKVEDLDRSSDQYKSTFSISVNNSEYTENENGERKFEISGTASQRHTERWFNNFYVSKNPHVVANFYNSNGEETSRSKSGNIYNNFITIGKFNPSPVVKNWSINVSGINNLPDDIMTVKLIARADNSGASNVVTITKTLVSNISEKVRLKRESQNQKNQNITFNEQKNSGDFNETPITEINLSSGCSECTGEKVIDPIIKKGYHTMPDGSLMKDSDMEKGNYMKIAGIAAAGVIGLLLYTKGDLK